jgi:hypothetical protein
MTSTEQLFVLAAINGPQLATATDRILYASARPPALPAGFRAARAPAARPGPVAAAASRVRIWIVIALIVVAAGVVATLVAHTGPEVVDTGGRGRP